MLPAPIAPVLPSDDLPLRLDPSNFPLRVRYRLPNCVDLFSLVVALGRKDLPAPGGGGGGAAAPFPRGIGGGGAGANPVFKGTGGIGSDASAELEPKDSGGGGSSAIFGCSTGGVGIGGSNGTVYVVGRGGGGGDNTNPGAFFCRVGVSNGLGDTDSLSYVSP